MAFLLSRMFEQFRNNEGAFLSPPPAHPAATYTPASPASKRRLLAAAAAAGVSVAFGSPLGGVLFGLEGAPRPFRPAAVAPTWIAELDTFANESDVMWRGFVTSVIAAVALQYIDPFGTSKLVLFQVRLSLTQLSGVFILILILIFYF